MCKPTPIPSGPAPDMEYFQTSHLKKRASLGWQKCPFSKLYREYPLGLHSDNLLSRLANSISVAMMLAVNGNTVAKNQA